jgi:hypothetical protein
MIRVILPSPLHVLASCPREVRLEISGPVCQRSILNAIENANPALRGTLRDQVTLKRRPLVRFFACGEDLSHSPPDAELPEKVASGVEAFYIIGAIAGG